MRPAECRQEVVQSNLVGQISDLHRRRELLVLLRVEQVVGTDAQVEDMAWFYAVGIVIVVLRAGLRQEQQLRQNRAAAAVIGAEAAGEGSYLAAAGKSDAGLLRVAEIVQRK